MAMTLDEVTEEPTLPAELPGGDVKVQKLQENAIIPTRASDGSAGYDLCAVEDVVLSPGERRLVGTGLVVEIPTGYAGLVFARSGLASKHGLGLANGVGVVDSDYRGQVMACVWNAGSEVYAIKAGDRIAQMVLVPFAAVGVEEVRELSATVRGTGGFGSTGR